MDPNRVGLDCRLRKVATLASCLAAAPAFALVVDGVACEKTETVGGLTACVAQATLDGAPFAWRMSVGNAALDLDGDGVADLVLSPPPNLDQAVPVPVSFFRGKGNGRDFTRFSPAITGNGGVAEAHFARHVAVGDFNGDGLADFFIADATERHDASGFGYGTPQFLYLARGDGSFAKLDTGVGVKIVHGEATGIPIRDGFALLLNTPWKVVDRSENYLNLVSIGPGGTPVAKTYLNGFTAASPYLTAIDADGDGVRDVVQLGRHPDNAIVVLHNDGSGNLTPGRVLPSWIANSHYQAENYAVADFNGDGRPDMLVLHIDWRDAPPSKHSSLRVWINDGLGGFRDETATWLGTDLQDYSGGFYDMAVADFDGDGFTDFVFTAGEPRYSANSRLAVVHNVGGKRFEVLDFASLHWGAYSDPPAYPGQDNGPAPGSHPVLVPVNGSPTVLWLLAGKLHSLRFVRAAQPQNRQGLWWNAPDDSEPGWGLNLAQSAGRMFGTWFTYDAAGKPWWSTMILNETSPGIFSGPVYETRGPRLDSAPWNASLVSATAVGTAALDFTSAPRFSTTTKGRSVSKTIKRQPLGPAALPACAYATDADPAAATNATDIWYAAPANSEPGWGVNLTQAGDTLFLAWFTYDAAGAPAWFVATTSRTSATQFAGDLYRTTGSPFYAFDRGSGTASRAGSARLTFAGGNAATFDYVVDGIAQSKAIVREQLAAGYTICR